MTTTLLKIIALISMLIDHTGQFIPNTPEYFRWVGRLAAPIFIYCVAIGYKYTSNRKKYMTRLYISSVAMAAINLGFNLVYSDSGLFITNNFFATLFMICIIIYLLDKQKVKLFVYFILLQIIGAILCIVFSEILIISNYASYTFYGAIFGNVFFVEGGILFVLLGGLFFMSKNKILLTINYIVFCLIIFLSFKKWGGSYDFFAYHVFPYADYQWVMIAALPFILLYNGKRGSGLKYFFYFFYPIHIIILYLIGISLL